MSDTAQSAIVRKLNEYCFRTIWNEVHAEYSANIALNLYSTKFLTGQLVNGINLALPTLTDQYVAYMVHYSVLNGGLPISQDAWIDSATVINTYGIIVNLYDINGHVVPKGTVYLYKPSTSRHLYVAILKASIVKVVGYTNYINMYLSLYRDTTFSDPITCSSFFITPSSANTVETAVTDTIITSRAINDAGTFITINGIEQDNTQTLLYTSGDYVDIVCDRNVIAGIAVNVSLSNTGYYSSLDARYKEVVHIPKATNPNNTVITHNTCTFTVRSNTTHKGLYLHRNDPTCITQITHNDFGVATTVINAFRDTLGDQDVSVYVRLRTQGVNKILSTDAFYIFVLYSCTDAQIVQFLRGQGDVSLDFWAAENLEKKSYIPLMFYTPTIADSNLLDSYISTLGYYTVASILSQHLVYATIVSPTQSTYLLPKGFAFRGLNTYPLVYLNGIKLNHNSVDYINYGFDQIAIGLSDTLTRNTGQPLSVNLVAGGLSQAYFFNPNALTPSFTVPFSDVEVYQVINTPNISGYNTSTTLSYKKLSLLDGTINLATVSNGTSVTFGMSLYGANLLIRNRVYVKEYNFSLDSMLYSHQSLIFNLTDSVISDSTNTALPLLSYGMIDAFINGRFLIPNLDYTLLPITDSLGNTALTQLVVSNMDYLNTQGSGNILEIIVHSAKLVMSETGYAVNNTLSYDTNVNLLFPGLTATYCHGRLCTSVVDHGTYIDPGISVANGQPYYLQTTLDQQIKIDLESYESTINQTYIQAINAYFYETITPNNNTVVVPNSYMLYSPYILTIINDTISGSFTPSAEPDPNKFLTQFIQYDYLKERDASLISLSVNLTYVDVDPCYTVINVTNVPLYTALHRLVSLMLPTDTNTLGEITND